jgi:2-furoyl-CoA dehydrogenase FAD binding subunit
MKPAPFDYFRPRTVEEALKALGDHGEAARVLAGGQSLVAMLNMRLAQPALVVDIGRLTALDRIAVEGDRLMVGAAVTQATLERWPGLAEQAPLLAAALPWVGHFQTRNRGTVCGSIAHADPSAELPLCLAVLGGEVVLRSFRGRRAVMGGRFFTGTLTTLRRADELIEAVRFPLKRPRAGYAFRELGLRHGYFAICAVAAVAEGEHLRIGIGGVSDRPVVRELGALGNDALDDALNELAWDLGAADDVHATAAYRRGLVRNLGRQAIEEARSCRS